MNFIFSSCFVKSRNDLEGEEFELEKIDHLKQSYNDVINCGIYVCMFYERHIQQTSQSASFDIQYYRKYIYQKINQKSAF